MKLKELLPLIDPDILIDVYFPDGESYIEGHRGNKVFSEECLNAAVREDGISMNPFDDVLKIYLDDMAVKEITVESVRGTDFFIPVVVVAHSIDGNYIPLELPRSLNLQVSHIMMSSYLEDSNTTQLFLSTGNMIKIQGYFNPKDLQVYPSKKETQI